MWWPWLLRLVWLRCCGLRLRASCPEGVGVRCSGLRRLLWLWLPRLLPPLLLQLLPALICLLWLLSLLLSHVLPGCLFAVVGRESGL